MTRCLMLACLMAFASTVHAEDWTQFLGAKRDSNCSATVAPWKEKPKELWATPVGEGHSSPVVKDGTVFLFYKPKKLEGEALAAYDLKTGEQRWEKTYTRDKFTNAFGNGPRGTPAIDGDFVYTFGCNGLLTCWAIKDGEQKWQLDTLKEFKAKNLFFGMSTSTTVVGQNVIVMVGGTGAGIIGVDKTTGKLNWQATSDRASYASPILDDKKNLVFLTGDHVRALDPANGKEVWSYPFVDELLESSTTPVLVGDKVVAASIKSGCVSLSITGKEVTADWKQRDLTCYFSTPVVVGEDLYMINGDAKTLGGTILKCVDPKTGKTKWTKPQGGNYAAAILKTKNDLLLLHDDKGELVLIQPDPKEYKELSRSKVSRFTWAHPAVVDGVYIIRDEKNLLAIELPKK